MPKISCVNLRRYYFFCKSESFDLGRHEPIQVNSESSNSINASVPNI